VDDLYRAIEDSHKNLGKIGDGDWTPQDSVHMQLLTTIEKLLASGGLRTGRIIHGYAE
jgi:hypothetical protein